MTMLFFYLIIAILILTLAIFLGRQARERDDFAMRGATAFHSGVLDRSCLDLAQRIFDPSDYRWLRDELRFPQLAKSLAHHRRALALQWLRALGNSFNELVRSSQWDESGTVPNDTLSSWALLFMTLRFHFLLSFAILVVQLFGPYHRLVPSFGSLRWSGGVETQEESYGMVNAGESR